MPATASGYAVFGTAVVAAQQTALAEISTGSKNTMRATARMPSSSVSSSCLCTPYAFKTHGKVGRHYTRALDNGTTPKIKVIA